MRKALLLLCICLPLCLLLTGCYAALGAGVGAAVDEENPWRGAAIGGAIGTALDALTPPPPARYPTRPHGCHHRYRRCR